MHARTSTDVPPCDNLCFYQAALKSVLLSPTLIHPHMELLASLAVCALPPQQGDAVPGPCLFLCCQFQGLVQVHQGCGPAAVGSALSLTSSAYT
jgi:hypothetical protein